MIRVKICGIRTCSEALAVAQAGADAVGVIVGAIGKTEHAVDVDQARKVFEALESAPRRGLPDVRKVLVTHWTESTDVVRLLEACPEVDEIQLHGELGDERYVHLGHALRELGVGFVRTIHVTRESGAGSLVRRADASGDALAVLVDTATGERLGGTGVAHDWRLSARVRAEGRAPLILAGGLQPENVAEAIRRVRPDGIDVNTGVRLRGVRSNPQAPDRVARLVNEVRRAEGELLEGALAQLTSRIRGGDRVVFFAGAGASAVPGIPLGDDLRDKLLRYVYPDSRDADDALARYRSDHSVPVETPVPLEHPVARFLELAPPGVVSRIFEGELSDRRPSVTHLALTDLSAVYENVRVATVNQDGLFEDAMVEGRLGGEVRVTCDEWARARHRDVLKIHGEMLRPETLAIGERETSRLPSWKRESLDRLMRGASVVCLGYSYRDQDILDLFDAVEADFFNVDPFPDASFGWKRRTRQVGLSVADLPASCEAFFSRLCPRLGGRYLPILWDAASGAVTGAYRDASDEWNAFPDRYFRRKCLIVGSAPGQNATREWTGGDVTFDIPRIPRGNGVTRTELSLHVPPGDGKGIHGAEGSVIRVNLLYPDGTEDLAGTFSCSTQGKFLNFYAHHPDDRAPRIRLSTPVGDVSSRAGTFAIRLEVPERACFDAHEVCLHVYRGIASVGRE